jgi:hypothetical protein
MFFYAVFGLALFSPAQPPAAARAFFVVLTAIGLAFGPFASAAAQTYTHSDAARVRRRRVDRHGG